MSRKVYILLLLLNNMEFNEIRGEGNDLILSQMLAQEIQAHRLPSAEDLIDQVQVRRIICK